jgi:YaiO family outer membrane protein
VSGLVATVAFTRLDSEAGHYDRTISGGGLYYHGRFVWSGAVSFNRNDPGGAGSTSGSIAVQYGAEKKYWIGGSFVGGHVAYQTISLRPLDLRFETYNPAVFVSKWLGRKWGVTGRYDYQNQVHAYQRHGIAGSLFFELP